MSRRDEIQRGDLAIAWAATPSAPASISSNGDKLSSFVFGNVRENREEPGSDADYMLQIAKEQGITAIARQYGFYLACFWNPAETVLGTDILGFFPLYYYATPQFLMFSTSYSFFKHSPDFSPEISPRGLAGILLTMQIAGGHTLFKNVRRLPAGHALRWQQERGAAEIPAGFLEPSDHSGDAYEEHVEIFDRLLDGFLSKTAHRQEALLLSGGLDSRLLAGYLGEMAVENPVAVSIGDSSDNDVRFAQKVAREIGWPYKRFNVEFSLFPEYARKLVELEQISNGFTDLAFFQSVKDLKNVSRYITTGFAGDLVMGGSHIRSGYDEEKRQYSFEAKFRYINRYGLSPEQVRQLVRPEFLGDGLEAALADLKAAYDSIEALPYQKSSIFDIYHRVRFHTAASIAWRLSFGAWPIMPYVHKEIIEAAMGMPAASLLGRRAQIDLLCRRFPSLAALPVERMNHNTRPPIEPFYGRLFAALRRRSAFDYRMKRAKRLLKLPEHESRSYFRTFDINNAGWTAVREDAEQHRNKAERIFDARMLKELMPPPGVPIRVRTATVDSSARKLLLAFMLWAGENL